MTDQANSNSEEKITPAQRKEIDGILKRQGVTPLSEGEYNSCFNTKVAAEELLKGLRKIEDSYH